MFISLCKPSFITDVATTSGPLPVRYPHEGWGVKAKPLG